jgi:glycosyltransferase involved in cell wall biosynthesis
VPYPPHGGAFQRSYNLIVRVAAVHELHLVAIRHKCESHPGWTIESARAALLQHCHAVRIVDLSHATRGVGLAFRLVRSLVTGVPLSVGLSSSSGMTPVIRHLLAETTFDLVHVDTIGMAAYLDDLGVTPALMAHMGAETFMMRRRITNEPSALRRWFFRQEARMLESYERDNCSRVALNVVVSELDRERLRQCAPAAKFAIVSNGVDIDYYKPAMARGVRSLVFAGRLDQYASRDAIMSFMAFTWPMLRRRYPDAEIHILGNNAPDALIDLATPGSGVHVHGFVPDVRVFFDIAAVSICPLRDGGGTRMKILDALAQGMPIVATTVACEGLDVVPERHLLIADSPEGFVAQIGRLFDDPDLRMELSKNARALAEDVYSWDKTIESLLECYQEVCRRQAGDPAATSEAPVTGARSMSERTDGRNASA